MFIWKEAGVGPFFKQLDKGGWIAKVGYKDTYIGVTQGSNPRRPKIFQYTYRYR